MPCQPVTKTIAGFLTEPALIFSSALAAALAFSNASSLATSFATSFTGSASGRDGKSGRETEGADGKLTLGIEGAVVAPEVVTGFFAASDKSTL
jgi:hypothetical protein